MIRVEQVGPRLKQTRLDQGKSIDEIALATRISKKFLLEIEAGTAPALPESYVQSFIRAYARYLDLDLDQLEHPIEISTATWETSRRTGGANEIDWLFDSARQPGTGSRQMRILLTIGIGIIVALVGFIVLVSWTDTRPSVEERRFSDVIAEHESTFAVTRFPIARDSIKGGTLAATDSLRLDALASDTIWIRVVVDGGRIREHTLLPGERQSWKARDSFVLSVSDGGAVQFFLEGRSLGFLGKAGRPLWNTIIDRSTSINTGVKHPSP